MTSDSLGWQAPTCTKTALTLYLWLSQITMNRRAWDQVEASNKVALQGCCQNLPALAAASRQQQAGWTAQSISVQQHQRCARLHQPGSASAASCTCSPPPGPVHWQTGILLSLHVQTSPLRGEHAPDGAGSRQDHPAPGAPPLAGQHCRPALP